jgi:hypothetical protein
MNSAERGVPALVTGSCTRQMLLASIPPKEDPKIKSDATAPTGQNRTSNREYEGVSPHCGL